MKNRRKINKKLKMLILFITLLFSFFLLVYNKERNYSTNYKVDNFKIDEEYHKKSDTYEFTVTSKKNKYKFIIVDKYSKERRVLKKIKEYTIDSQKCITFIFKDNNKKIICKDDKSYLSSNIISDNLKTKIDKSYFNNSNKSNKEKEFNNIKINNLHNSKIFIWNYNGFTVLDKSKNMNIKLFDKYIYNPSLITKIDNYLLIPNYDDEVEFDSFYILDINTLKVDTLKLNDSISYDSYVMGINDKSVFIYDLKYKQEYEIVPEVKKYRSIYTHIYDKGKEKKLSDIYVVNNKPKFIYNDIFIYSIIDNKLYRADKYTRKNTLLTNREIKDIINYNFDKVYYLSSDSLYLYNKDKEYKILEYFEFNFNYKNIIYIFD